MRPLPTNPLPATDIPAPRTLELGPASAAPNHRRSAAAHGAYPWLLLASTLLAGVFCFLYLTKPVIASNPSEPVTAATAEPTAPAAADPAPVTKPAPASSEVVSPDTIEAPEHGPYEETNLRIQHVLGASAPDGTDLGRLTLDVPVLYQSGAIRWNRDDVTKARSLLSRIDAYQDRSRALREEAVMLISEWDNLIVSSIPEPALRADSPTLPENQGPGAADQAPLRSTEAIEIDAR